MSSRLNATLQVLLAFGLWSSLAVFFNKVTLPTSVYVVFGSLVGLCFLYGYFYLVKRSIPKFTFSWELIGLFLVAALKGLVWFRALALFPVAKALLIHHLDPVVALIFAPLLIKEKPSFNHFVAVVTGFLGLAMLLKFDNTPGQLLQLGVVLSLLSALSSGLQDVLQRKISRTISGSAQSLIFILGQAFGGIIFLVPSLPHSISWPDLGGIVYFGLFGTAIPIILLSNGFKHLRSFEVSILGYIEPALGALWGGIFLGQAFAPSTAIGGVLIFLSGITALKEERKLSD